MVEEAERRGREAEKEAKAKLLEFLNISVAEMKGSPTQAAAPPPWHGGYSPSGGGGGRDTSSVGSNMSQDLRNQSIDRGYGGGGYNGVGYNGGGYNGGAADFSGLYNHNEELTQSALDIR